MCMIPLCGDWFFGGGAYFFQQGEKLFTSGRLISEELISLAGMGTEDSFSFNMGLWTMACIGTVVSWFIIPVSGVSGRVYRCSWTVCWSPEIDDVWLVRDCRTVRQATTSVDSANAPDCSSLECSRYLLASLMAAPSKTPELLRLSRKLIIRWAQAALVLICLFVFNVTVAVSHQAHATLPFAHSYSHWFTSLSESVRAPVFEAKLSVSPEIPTSSWLYRWPLFPIML